MADVNQPFSNFINLMGKDAARDLVRKINTFMKDFKARPTDPDQDSRYFQDFMVHMEGEIAKHPLWAGASAQELDAAVEALEKYLMTKLYDRAFACTAEEVERDQLLTVRMSALQFLMPEHLEIPAHVVDAASLGVATHELNKINLYKAPKDKLVCILNCCRVVNSMLAARIKADGIGADDFTPLLIFVVIKSQANHLSSNLAYIERYHMASRLVSEAQYYFTQLCSAATFIELVHAGSFKVNQDEFIANMLAHGALTDEQLALMACQSGSPLHPASSLGSMDSYKAAAAAAAAGGVAAPRGLAMQALPSAGSSQAALAAQQQAAAAAAAAAPSFLPPRTVEELEAQGAALLAGHGGSSRLAGKHPYAFAHVDQLTLGDVTQLLSAYKELVLRYECLAAALAWHQAHPAGGPSSSSSPSKAGAASSSQPPLPSAAASAPAAMSAPPPPPAAAAAAAAGPASSTVPGAAAAPALVASAPAFEWPEEESPAAAASQDSAVRAASSSGQQDGDPAGLPAPTAAAAVAGGAPHTGVASQAAPAVPPPPAAPAVAAPAETPVDQLLQDLLGGPEASSGSVGQAAGGVGSTAAAAAPSGAADSAQGGVDLLGDDLLAGLTINEPSAAGQQQQPLPPGPAPSLLD